MEFPTNSVNTHAINLRFEVLYEIEKTVLGSTDTLSNYIEE
jgi:hypothetical protein